ncbi:MAG: MinD/ParA family protein [Candidatus Hydrogenedentes bacterium]|nr:MinD/ParA family protein [Candidatus Hydrogenedentota bacterium]
MADQAQRLRELVWGQRGRARVLAVTSGKGGVGKTNTSVNLAIALAAYRKRVILLDADLGLANVEVLMGLNSLYNIENVIEGEKTMREILAPGPGGIQVVPGSSGLAKLADLSPAGRQNVLNGLSDLQELAEFVVIDTMAGIGRNAVSFATAADEVILVTTPEPSAIVDAYAMLKTIHNTRKDAVVRLLVNMVGNQAQAKAVAAKLAGVAQQYLSRNLSLLGYLPRDPSVSQAVMQSRPFILQYPNAPVSKYMQMIASRLVEQQPAPEPQRESFFKRFATSLGIAGNG